MRAPNTRHVLLIARVATRFAQIAQVRVEYPSIMGAAEDNPSFISPERLKLKDPNLLSPYERLLLIINNKHQDDRLRR
jgi:hypothetical protein